MQVPEIRQLSELIQPYLGENTKLLSHKIDFLTSPGENYGSLIVSVDIKILENDKEKEVFAVAKLCPPNEFVQEMFQTQTTFKKEIAMYTEAIPALLDFQKRRNVPDNEVLDIFPKCLGARINLTGSDKVDTDAAILLENLKNLGYVVADRFTGFSLEQSLMIIKHLAWFHATVIGLKMLEPNVFSEKVLPALKRAKMGGNLFGDDAINTAINNVVEQLSLSDFDTSYFANVETGLRQSFDIFKQESTPNRTFVSILHMDCWVNNIMVLEKDGKILNNKFVDFQTQTYDSCLRDLIFFLFTSIQQPVLQQNFESFVKLYYESFIDCLKKLRCDTEPFSEKVFQDEFDECGKNEFFHVVLMLKPIFAEKGTVKEIAEFSLSDFVDQTTYSDKYRQKLKDTVTLFVNKKWI